MKSVYFPLEVKAAFGCGVGVFDLLFSAGEHEMLCIQVVWP